MPLPSFTESAPPFGVGALRQATTKLRLVSGDVDEENAQFFSEGPSSRGRRVISRTEDIATRDHVRRRPRDAITGTQLAFVVRAPASHGVVAAQRAGVLKARCQCDDAAQALDQLRRRLRLADVAIAHQARAPAFDAARSDDGTLVLTADRERSDAAEPSDRLRHCALARPALHRAVGQQETRGAVARSHRHRCADTGHRHGGVACGNCSPAQHAAVGAQRTGMRLACRHRNRCHVSAVAGSDHKHRCGTGCRAVAIAQLPDGVIARAPHGVGVVDETLVRAA